MSVSPSSSRSLLTRRGFAKAVSASVGALAFSASGAQGEWIDLFDGRTLQGWRPSENKDSWTVVDGALAANGPRSHLFYDGPVRNARFKNFELETELTTEPYCNSGVYFHTAYQETGFPEKGFEVQVNNTARGEGNYRERKKTGSLYGVRNMYKQLVPDEVPFQLHISVRGKNVQIRLNSQLLVDYVEPTPPVIPAGGEKERFLGVGTFALQCHNDGSRAAFRRVRVRPLPDDLPAYIGAPPQVDQTYRDIIDIGRHNLPMVDFQVRLQPGLDLEQALRKSRADGIQYGLVADVQDLSNDAAAERWLAPFAGRPVFLGLAAQRSAWTHKFSRATVARFDYVVAQGNGQQNVDAMIRRLQEEPLDLLSLHLPGPSVPLADEKSEALVRALVENKVALELTDTTQMPPPDLIRRAKEAGCKFAFGTANRTAADLRRCEYGLRMVKDCGLQWQDFWLPGAWWPKAVDRRRA